MAYGDPPFAWNCISYSLIECQTAGCSSDPNADTDDDDYYEQTPNCTPATGQADCNDDVQAIHPGQEETDCFDSTRVDENCNNKANCEDPYCRNTYGSGCDAQCDADGDGHYSLACGGDDCQDSLTVTPNAGFMHGGLDDFGDPMTEWSCSGLDEDCDGLPNCADPDCSGDPACQASPTPTPPTGGDPTYYPNQPYCYSYFAVTDWYVSYNGGETWSYYYSTWEYIGEDCYLLFQ